MPGILTIIILIAVLLLFAALEATIVLFVIWKIDGWDKKRTNNKTN